MWVSDATGPPASPWVEPNLRMVMSRLDLTRIRETVSLKEGHNQMSRRFVRVKMDVLKAALTFFGLADDQELKNITKQEAGSRLTCAVYAAPIFVNPQDLAAREHAHGQALAYWRMLAAQE